MGNVVSEPRSRAKAVGVVAATIGLLAGITGLVTFVTGKNLPDFGDTNDEPRRILASPSQPAPAEVSPSSPSIFMPFTVGLTGVNAPDLVGPNMYQLSKQKFPSQQPFYVTYSWTMTKQDGSIDSSPNCQMVAHVEGPGVGSEYAAEYRSNRCSLLTVGNDWDVHSFRPESAGEYVVSVTNELTGDVASASFTVID